MVWASLDDGFCDHPKVEALSDAAFRLHVAAICYCARLLTDGHVSLERVPRLVRRYRPKLLVELVDGGVWHRCGHRCASCPQPAEGSVYLHDFLAVPNRSKAQVQRDRERAADRQRRLRDSREQSRRDSPGDFARTNGSSHTAPSPPLPCREDLSDTHVPPQSALTDDHRAAEADRRTADRAARGGLTNPDAYRASILADLHRTGWTPIPSPQSALPDGAAVIADHRAPEDQCAPPPAELTRAHRRDHGMPPGDDAA